MEIQAQTTADNIIVPTESLKLSKTSRGYSWEIKITEINIKRLSEINEEMKTCFGVDFSKEDNE